MTDTHQGLSTRTASALTRYNVDTGLPRGSHRGVVRLDIAVYPITPLSAGEAQIAVAVLGGGAAGPVTGY